MLALLCNISTLDYKESLLQEVIVVNNNSTEDYSAVESFVKENPKLWEAAAHAVEWSAAWGAARDAASASLLSLVIYDDCDQYLALGYEKLKVYAVLSEKPQAILLLPMAYVREKMNESPPVSSFSVSFASVTR